MKEKKLPFLLEVCRELIRRYFRDQVGRDAAELAYYLLFSLFPLIIFLNAAISTLQLSPSMLTDRLGLALPPQAADIVTAYLSYIQGLDTPFLLYACLVLAVYAVSRSISSLLNSLSKAYGIDRRGAFRVVAGVMCAVLLLFSVVAVLVLMVISDNLLLWLNQYVTIPALLIRLWDLLRVLIAPLFLFLVLAFLYTVVGYGKYSFSQALPGAGFAVVLWYLSTTGFSYYVNNMSRYSVLYGSLTAFMVLMLWFYLTCVVIILGGELNHILADTSDKGD